MDRGTCRYSGALFVGVKMKILEEGAKKYVQLMQKGTQIQAEVDELLRNYFKNNSAKNSSKF